MLVTQQLQVNFSSSHLRKFESIELVVRRTEAEVAVARTPEDHTVGDGRARQARTAAGEIPKNGAGSCVQGVHVTCRVEGASVHNPVCCRHRAGSAAPMGGDGLPEHFPGHCIQPTPNTFLVMAPPGRVHGMALLLALAV